MAYTKQLLYELLRSIDSSTLSGSYQAVGTALINACSIIKMVNNSSSLVTISINGTSDVDVLPPNSFFLYDVTTNKPDADDAIFATQGRQYYVKGSAGTGLIYLVAQYIVQISNALYN